MTEKFSIGTYKPGKAKGLWKFYVFRILPGKAFGGFGLKEYLTKTGTWSLKSIDLQYFRTIAEAKIAGEKAS